MGRISTSELVNIIYEFCELYSGRVLFPYQEQYSKRVIRSILENDGAEITALFSRQGGKTETISVTVGGCMIILPKLANMPMFADDPRLSPFKDGFWVGIFAPSLRQSQITYNRLRSRLQCKAALAVLNDPDFRLSFNCSNGQTVALSNGSFCTAISASDGSSIEGESFKFIICEECQDISNFKIRKSIHPMGAAYNATIAKIGTSTTFKGDFYDAIQRNKRDYDQGNIKIRNHFEYDYTVIMKYNHQYAKYIEMEKARLGEDSDEFRMSYKLEWILSTGMFIDDINEFEKKNGEPNFERTLADQKVCHVVGIDLGGKNDDTVVTVGEVDWENPVILEAQVNEDGEEETFIAYNCYIKDWLEIFGDNYENQYHTIIDYLKNFRVARVCIDATKESSIADRMRANMPYEVIPFVFTTKSKSELYKHLSREIKSGRARFPSGSTIRQTREYKKFLGQLGELQKSYSGQYLVVCHPPERNAHDDYPDSWALMVFAAKEKGESTKVETVDKRKAFNDRNAQTHYNRRNNITARRRR
jgi:hypothetical protein